MQDNKEKTMLSPSWAKTAIIFVFMSLLLLSFVFYAYSLYDKAEYLCEINNLQHKVLNRQHETIGDLKDRIYWMNETIEKEIDKIYEGIEIPEPINCTEYLG